MSINSQIAVTTLFLIFSVIFFGLSNADILIQDRFFDVTTQQWILDRNIQPYKFIFYNGIKIFLIIFAVTLLFALVFFRRHTTVKRYKKGLMIVVLSAIFVPVVVGGLKKTTNMPCPKDEIHYGGMYPKTKVWVQYPKQFSTLPKIRCYPAGHASGGFALLSLFFLFRQRKNKFLALAIGLTTGWSMGLYKMFIGDHFFSHTFITMVLAWLVVLLLVKVQKAF